jgi:predicted SnoaL-like aldol condensation-catalyzing enzyme
MKKAFGFLMAAAVTVLVASCGGGNTPSSIEKSIYSQMVSGNYEKAVEILADNLDSEKTPSAEERAEFITGFTEKAKESAEAKGGLKSFEIVSEEIAEDGLSATVTSKIVYGDGSEDSPTSKYIKKDGKWKLSMGK